MTGLRLPLCPVPAVPGLLPAGMVRFALVLLLAAWCCTGCGTAMTRETLLRSMEEGTGPTVIDVRTQGEYDRGHLPGAVHIAFYAVRSGLAEQGLSKEAPVLVYCEHGPRAGIAGLLLTLSGYETVYSLEGHMRSWRESGYPIEVIAR